MMHLRMRYVIIGFWQGANLGLGQEGSSPVQEKKHLLDM